MLALRSWFSNRSSSLQNIGFLLIIILLVVSIASSRIYKLDSVPAGLFFDESSIGYNAITILRLGQDEHGVRYPIYFKSVGDYKNPLYIYAVAIIFSMFGTSEFTLRLTSVIFFGVALFFWVLLVVRMFDGKKIVTVFGLLAFGFSPLFFVVSRVSFEIVSQLAVVSALNLSIWVTFSKPTQTRSWFRDAVVCGFLLGLSTYSYTTQRFLSSLTLVILWLVFYKRENFYRLLLVSTIFFLSLLPFICFAYENPGVITERFNGLSYIDDPIGVPEKLSLFLQNYKTYWKPDFWIIHGDPNLRHSTGRGGVSFMTVSILFLLSLPLALRKINATRFMAFVVISLLVTPLPAALIPEGAPHALRSMLMGYYVLVLSCYSLAQLASLEWLRLIKSVIFACLFIGLIVEVIGFEVDYFLFYPSRSVEDFGSFDFKSALEFALEHEPEKIIAAGLPPGGYAHVQFYSEIIDNPEKVQIEISDFTEPSPRTCILFHRRTEIETRLDGYSLPFDNFFSRNKLGALEKMVQMDKFGGVIRVRCY